MANDRDDWWSIRGIGVINIVSSDHEALRSDGEGGWGANDREA